MELFHVTRLNLVAILSEFFVVTGKLRHGYQSALLEVEVEVLPSFSKEEHSTFLKKILNYFSNNLNIFVSVESPKFLRDRAMV